MIYIVQAIWDIVSNPYFITMFVLGYLKGKYL